MQAPSKNSHVLLVGLHIPLDARVRCDEHQLTMASMRCIQHQESKRGNRIESDLQQSPGIFRSVLKTVLGETNDY